MSAPASSDLAPGTRHEGGAEQPAAAASVRVERLEAGNRSIWRSLRELWRARELVAFLIQRDLKVRYKQTFLGAAWALLQPAATMVVFSIFFSRLVDLPGGIPYPVFALAGLVPWTFFSASTSNSAGSLLANASMLSKVYFPRLAMPLAAVGASLVDLVLALGLLAVVMLAYGIVPDARVVFLPAFTLLALMSAAGLGFLLSALSVEYRDFRYIVPFMLQLWLFATPVAYPSDVLDEPWKTLFALNPMVGVVTGFRWALFGTGSNVLTTVLISSAVAVGLLLAGVAYFHRREPLFADVA